MTIKKTAPPPDSEAKPLGVAEDLLREIELVIDAGKITATAFGLDLINDPNFVGDLRAGRRDVKASTIDKARAMVRRLSVPAEETTTR